jgi:antitoxin VapB
MSIFVKDPSTSQAVRELAKLRGVSLTEAIRDAVQKALVEQQRLKSENFLEAVRRLQAEVAKYPDTGLKADKAFYDDLSGDI